jgi:2-polyprenyl-3-methyl-5-hydroxy-6-metoxy-1,4-benzoquinol methylase
MSVEQKVRGHFHADAKRFDAIYEEEKGPVTRFIDHVWRGVVRRRLDLALEKLAPFEGRTYLDVGTGSGRFCHAYAQRGAAKCVGVDFAPAMIEIADDLAKRLGVQDRCEFRVGAFPEAVPDGPFDGSSAMGFFDYIDDPVPILTRMRELTSSVLIASFPKSAEWRVPLRRLRFWMIGCPLFLYSESRVREIAKQAGITNYEWIEMDRDYVIVGRF